MIKLNEDIEFVLKKLLEYGEGYIVGGYIRDYFLGIEPNDCDFTTNIEQKSYNSQTSRNQYTY